MRFSHHQAYGPLRSKNAASDCRSEPAPGDIINGQLAPGHDAFPHLECIHSVHVSLDGCGTTPYVRAGLPSGSRRRFQTKPPRATTSVHEDTYAAWAWAFQSAIAMASIPVLRTSKLCSEPSPVESSMNSPARQNNSNSNSNSDDREPADRQPGANSIQNSARWPYGGDRVETIL